MLQNKNSGSLGVEFDFSKLFADGLGTSIYLKIETQFAIIL